jgi:putative component of toxin-antitoxin plasmid stabilization module
MWGLSERVFLKGVKTTAPITAFITKKKKEIIILLCGGDKSTRQADIANAKRIAKLYEEE